MAAEAQAEEYSKRERIINAIAVYPERYEFDAEVVAELADASESYVYRIQRDMEDLDVEGTEFSKDLDEDLQQEYRDRIGDLLEEYGVERSMDEEESAQEASGGQEMMQEERPEATTEGIPVDQVRGVRNQLEILRKEADYGRENYEEDAVDVAHGKYYVANEAIELIDEIIEQAEPE